MPLLRPGEFEIAAPAVTEGDTEVSAISDNARVVTPAGFGARLRYQDWRATLGVGSDSAHSAWPAGSDLAPRL